MKGKKHQPEQIIRKLRDVDAMLSTGKAFRHATSNASSHAPCAKLSTLGSVVDSA